MPHHTLKKVKENIKGNSISKSVNMIYTQGHISWNSGCKEEKEEKQYIQNITISI